MALSTSRKRDKGSLIGKIGNIEVAYFKFSDIDQLVALEKSKWLQSQAATKDELYDRVNLLSDYSAGAFSEDGHLLASMFCRPTTFKTIVEAKTHRECAYGPLPLFENSVSYGGNDCLFGVSLTSKDAQGAAALFRTLLPALAHRGYHSLYGGSTLPGLLPWLKENSRKTVIDYVYSKTIQGLPLDRQLRYYYLNGFTTILSVKSHYFPHSQSLDYGAVVFKPLTK